MTRVPRNAPFLQHIEIIERRSRIGSADWHAAADTDGVIQLVELHIDPAHRRRGHGGAILRETISQAQALCSQNETSLRRIWVAVRQKTHVIARAFLTQNGFHHTATIKLHGEEDALVYVRSFD